jgi:hypothetical protein
MVWLGFIGYFQSHFWAGPVCQRARRHWSENRRKSAILDIEQFWTAGNGQRTHELMDIEQFWTTGIGQRATGSWTTSIIARRQKIVRSARFG